MVYGNELRDKKDEVTFRFELDDRGKYSEKDMFYVMYRLGLFTMVSSMARFWSDSKYAKEIIKRDKSVDKLYRKYKEHKRQLT